MVQFRQSLFALAVVPLFFVTAGQAAEKVPPELAAKRAGVKSQAAPSPLELVYTSIQPCRAFSKRVAANVAIAFQITGSGDFTGQGGPATGCGIPASAKSITLSFTTAQPTAAGLLTAYADGSVRPAVATLRFATGAAEAAAGTVGVGAAGKMAVYPNQTVNVAGDITGYFAPQLWSYTDGGGVLLDSSGRVTANYRSDVGRYRLTFDRDVSACSATASSDFSPKMMGAYTSGNSVDVYVQDHNGAYVDYWVNLHVMC